MLDQVIKFSIKNKLITILLVLGVGAWGVYSLTRLPIDAVPDITNNQVQILTVAPSLAAQEIERLITFPIEVTMANIPGIEEIRSFSRFGLSVVTIVWGDDVDLYWARQQVSERLSEVRNQIPKNVGSPALAPVTTGLGEIYQYVVRAKKGYEQQYTPMELRSIQDWIIKRQLIGTPGVAEVSSFGGYLKQYEIAIDPEKLRSANIRISEIFNALEKNNQNTGGAYIEKRPYAYFIRSEGLVGSLQDIEQIVVKTTASGVPVLIKDVAEVRIGNALRYGASTRNGEGEVVSAVVMMLKGDNSAQVIQNVKNRIQQIQKTLPEGVVIEPFLDRTKLVQKAIQTVSSNLIEGALIVIFILVLLLGNLKAGFIVASVIPLAMLFAFGMMNLVGVSGNLMSLGAIDFGLIVDGAVIIVEGVIHHLAHLTRSYPLTRQQMDEEVYTAASRIRSAAAFGEIIILIVYLPIWALVGVEGKMFKPMAQTVSFAILGAFFLSLTYVPMMSAWLLSPKSPHRETFSDKLIQFFHRLYEPVIQAVIRHKKLVIVLTVLWFVVSLYTFLNMGGEFIPTLEEGDFAVETRLLTGASLSETIEASLKAEKILLQQFPEVEQVVAKIGSGEVPTDPMPVESCDLMVILKDKAFWRTAKTREELANKMSEALSVIPGVTFGFQQPIQMRFNELLTGARQDVVIKIFGEDLSVLAQLAEKVAQLVQTVPGAQDLYVEPIQGLPQIQVQYHRNELAKYGLNLEDLNTLLETAFAGKSAGIVYEGEKRYEMVVRLHPKYRTDIQNVRNLYVPLPNGQFIPLEQVADVRFCEGPAQIQREDAKRRILVGFNVRNRDVESIVKEIQDKIEKNLAFPPGYYPTYGGQFENLVKAKRRLSVAVPIALLLILILLFFTFHSLKQCFLIFTAIPFSAIGGIWALYGRGMPFSISAGVGFIALFGVAVLNGIVLIAEFNRLKQEGVQDLRERVLRGTKTRLRPVLMTAMVASFGFLPMALSQSSGAEVQRPLATVVIGGLVTSTLLTLIVLPVLYLSFEPFSFRKGLMKFFGAMMLVGMLTVAGNALYAQPQDSLRSISLEQAIALALQNHPSPQAAQLTIQQNQKLKSTAFRLDKTQLSWQHGQYNSLYPDNYFEISQAFAFPTVYARQAKLTDLNLQNSQIQREITENELVTQVKTLYYQLEYAMARRNLLARLDSLWADFSKVAEKRYQTGETNLLEKMTAQTEQMNIRHALQTADLEVSSYQRQLQTLLNLQGPFSVEVKNLPRELKFALDEQAYLQHPALKHFQQQIEVEKQLLRLEKARLLPDLNIAYFNQSLTGYQNFRGTEYYFGPDKRFSGFRIGLGLPLWIAPHLKAVQAQKIQVSIAELRYEEAKKKIEALYLQALQEYQKQKASWDYYQKVALPQAEQLLHHAKKSFESGEIGYVEYMQAVRQSIRIQETYLQVLHQYNQAILQLEFLTGNR